MNIEGYESIVRKYADDILRVCYYYLGDLKNAHEAFEEVFVQGFTYTKTMINESSIRIELIRTARSICGADIVKDNSKAEMSLLTNYFGLSREDASYVMNKMKNAKEAVI